MENKTILDALHFIFELFRSKDKMLKDLIDNLQINDVKEGRKYLQASEEQSYEGFGVHKFRARYQEHGDGKELLSKDLADDISLGIICAFAEEKLIQYASSGKEDRAQEC